jgi:hypothetical protein
VNEFSELAASRRDAFWVNFAQHTRPCGPPLKEEIQINATDL